MKPQVKLTERMCRELKPDDKPLIDAGEYGGGRLMLVPYEKSDRKTWRFRVRRGGKDTTKALGTYPAMGLGEARIAARRMTSPQTDEPEASGSLDELLKAYVASLGTRPSARDARLAFDLAIPEDDPLRSREARSITTTEIAEVLRRRAATGATTSVNRLRSYAHAAFAFAAKHDYDPRRQDEAATFRIESNPVAGTPRVAEWERARKRVLTDDEIKAFITAARERNDALGDFWLLVLMIGARVANQLLTADFHEDMITITDHKGRGGRVKVCTVPVTAAMKPLLFRASLAHNCNTYTVRRAGDAMLPKDATPLDVRRTVETRLKALGIDRDLRGAMLSHGRSGVQDRHYEQEDPLLTRRKLAAWNKFHRLLESIYGQKIAA